MIEGDRPHDLKNALPFYAEPTQEQRAVWEAEKLADLRERAARWKRTHERLLFLGGYHHAYLDDADYSVSYHVDEDETRIHIGGDANTVDMEDMVSLTPKHAVALLAWLREEEGKLKQLAEAENADEAISRNT